MIVGFLPENRYWDKSGTICCPEHPYDCALLYLPCPNVLPCPCRLYRHLTLRCSLPKQQNKCRAGEADFLEQIAQLQLLSQADNTVPMFFLVLGCEVSATHPYEKMKLTGAKIKLAKLLWVNLSADQRLAAGPVGFKMGRGGRYPGEAQGGSQAAVSTGIMHGWEGNRNAWERQGCSKKKKKRKRPVNT